MIKSKAEYIKEEYIRRCSRAELAAMHLNGQITVDDYSRELKRRDDSQE